VVPELDGSFPLDTGVNNRAGAVPGTPGLPGAPPGYAPSQGRPISYPARAAPDRNRG
jgi:hypothetical protein